MTFDATRPRRLMRRMRLHRSTACPGGQDRHRNENDSKGAVKPDVAAALQPRPAAPTPAGTTRDQQDWGNERREWACRGGTAGSGGGVRCRFATRVDLIGVSNVTVAQLERHAQ
jgi:hypothetical protein